MNGPDTSERCKLEQRSGRLEWALVLFGALVVFGLVGETRTISSYMVTIGVAGEVIIGIFITKTTERIQELAKLEVAAANERGSKAEQLAAEANERSSKAEQSAMEARLAAVKLESENIAQLDRIKQSELLIIELRTKQAPRWTTFTLLSFLGSLTSKPTGRARVVFPPADGEACVLAQLIREGLGVSGWNVGPILPISPSPVESMADITAFGAQSTGITILTCTHPEALEGDSPYKALTEALGAIPSLRPIIASRNLNVPKDELWIVVGPKP